MQIVYLVVIAVLLGTFVRPSDKRSYYIAIMAIFGIAFFCLWRFIEFYLAVSGTDTSDKSVYFYLLMLVIGIVALLPIVVHIHRTAAIVLMLIFFAFVVPTFIFDKNIKDGIAILSGYFDDPAVRFGEASKPLNSTEYMFSDGGVSIQIPAGWQKKLHASGLSYFVRTSSGKVVAEMRPSCFHETELSIPEIVNNILRWDADNAFTSSKQCYLNSDSVFNCLIRSTGAGSAPVKEKWRWFMMDKYQRQNVEIDLIFYSASEQAKQDAKGMIDSAKWIPLKGFLPQCVGTIDWF